MADAHVERWLPHPPARVWRALSEPELAARWLPFDDYRPRVGHLFTARGPTGPASCEVLEIAAPHRVELSWHEEGITGRVTLAIVAERQGSRVSLTHSGLPESRLAVVGAFWTQRLGEPLRVALAGGVGATGLVGVGLAVLVAVLGFTIGAVWMGSNRLPGSTVPTPAVVSAPTVAPDVRTPEAPPAPREPELPRASRDYTPPEVRLTADALRVAETEFPTTLHPFFAQTDSDVRTHTLIFDRLFERSAITMELMSHVFEDTREQGSSLIATVRRDLRFHDGESVHADDVCFSVRALLDPRTPSSLPVHHRGLLTGCEVRGEYEAELTFVRALPDRGVLAEVPLLPAHLFRTTALQPDDPFSTRPIGSGPYRALRDRDRVVLAAHEGSPRAPSIASIEIVVVHDPVVASALLQSGLLDGIVEAPPIVWRKISVHDDLVLKTFDTRSLLYLAVHPRLSDPAVRDAVSRALDREQLCSIVMGAYGPMSGCKAISGPWLPRSPYSNRAVPVEPTRPLLPGVQSPKLRLGHDAALAPRTLDLYHQVRNQLAFAGFEVELVKAHAPDPDRMDLWLGRHTFDLDENVDRLLRHHPLGASSPEVDALLDAALQARTVTAQQDVRHELHAVIAAQDWLIPLITEDVKSAWRGDLRKRPITPRTFWNEVDRWPRR